MKPNIGITDKNLQNSTTLLSGILSDEIVLYTKTRKFHWNVTGESFMELHKLFEKQYKELEESIDEVAERIGKLGCNTIGTMKEFLSLSTIKERPDKYSQPKELLKELLSDHETMVVILRKGIEESTVKNKDAGTADILTGLMKLHETTSWVLRRYLN